MDEIVLISAPEVFQIPIEEGDESMVSLFGHEEIILDMRKQLAREQYSVRETILKKLLEAHQYLPYSLRFLIIESFRPLSIQTRYFTDYSIKLRKLHPEWNDGQIYAEASKCVSPPEIIPPHSTGGAVDLTLCDEGGKELDMGTRLNATR